MLKDVFVGVVFSGTGERFGCLCGGCQLSWTLPWPAEFLNRGQNSVPEPDSRVSSTMLGIHGESQWSDKPLCEWSEGRGSGGCTEDR